MNLKIDHKIQRMDLVIININMLLCTRFCDQIDY